MAVSAAAPHSRNWRLAVLAVHHVGEVVLGEQIQMPVHRRQADPVAAVAQLVMELLRGPESVRLAQQALDRGGLPRLADPSR